MTSDKMQTPERDPTVEFERRRKRKVALVGVLLTILCGLFIWQLFSPASETKEDESVGINVTMPDGRAQATVEDKRKAAEQVRTEEQQSRRRTDLTDNSFSLLDDGLKPSQAATDENPALRAAQANRALHSQVQGFYAQPARNAEVEALREQVAALQTQLETVRRQDDPLRMAEEQYKLAQKYLGGGASQGESAEVSSSRPATRKALMRPIRQSEVEASTLDPRVDTSRERNAGFLTAAGPAALSEAPTVKACVARTQVIRAEGTVCLRLLEPVRIEDVIIPRNTLLYGTASIAGIRLQVVISSVAYAGRIFDIQAVAYDADGQPGIDVPDSRERTALKEALASIGQTAGTSINVTRSAGQQIVADLSQGAMQASSRYLAEKLREVRITLKAEHRVWLISQEN